MALVIMRRGGGGQGGGRGEARVWLERRASEPNPSRPWLIGCCCVTAERPHHGLGNEMATRGGRVVLLLSLAPFFALLLPIGIMFKGRYTYTSS